MTDGLPTWASLASRVFSADVSLANSPPQAYTSGCWPARSAKRRIFHTRSSSGLAYTFSRDNLYLDFMTTLVGEDGVILTHPGDHADRTYELTGPEALSMSEIAGILSEARGSRVTYHDETVSEAYASRARWGAPDWQTDAWVTTYTAIAAGDLARVSDDITAITGQPPLSLAQLLVNAADSS